MKPVRSIPGLITVLTLLLSAIWLCPAAAAAPTFASLGQITAQGLRAPGAMDLDAAGNLYVADARGGKVHKFSPNGSLLQSFDLQASGRGLAVTPDGSRLYVAREAAVVIADALTGAELGALAGGVAFSMVGEIDLDAAGNVLVADVKALRINVYAPSSQYLTSFGSPGPNAGQFLQIRGLAVNPAGQVVVADSSSLNNKVHVFTLGADLQVLNVAAYASANAAYFGAPIMHTPRGLTFDSQGRGYVLDFMTAGVRVTSSSFTYQGAYASPGYAEGQLNNVVDTIYDNVNNRLFIGCDTGRVVILGVDGGQNPAGINRAPGAPVPQSPLGGNQVDSATPALVFQNASDEDGDSLTYQVVVKQGDTVVFQASVPEQTGTTTTVTVSEALAENQGYAWTVQANDGKLASEVSAAALFVVNAVDEAPSVPAPITPLAGESINERYELSWDASTDPDPNGHEGLKYLVAVSHDAQVIFEAEVAATSVQLDAALLTENLAYSWTVQGKDAGGNLSDTSPAANFVVNFIDDPPSVPELTAPLHGESINGAGELAWLASSDPDPNDDDANITYRIEVATDAAFTTLVATAEPLTELALGLSSLPSYADLVIGESYFWRVTAIGHDTLESAPSASGHFVFKTTVLTITANMPDASVSFHGNHAYAGQVVGVAPLELRDFPPGTLSVVVGRAGFEPFVAQITLNEGDNLDLYAALLPAMAVGNLSSSSNGINGRFGLAVNRDAAPFLVDFDNDGDLDLLVGDANGLVSLFANLQLINNNRIAFDQGVRLVQVQSAAVPFIVDWNNDGRKDLLVGQADGTVKLFLNNGLEQAPAFAAAVDLQTLNGSLNAGSGLAPAVLDYNGDGNKDLLVGNAAGKVHLFLNQGSDAAPQLADSEVILAVDGAVVPMPVDWDADGRQELLLTANGVVSVYAKVDGVFQAVKQFGDKKSTYTGAFPIDFFGTGKQLLAGLSSGELLYLSGNSSTPVDSFQPALLAKVDQLAGLVAAEAPQQLDNVAAIGVLIAAGDYPAAALAAGDLALALPAGPAQDAALELAALCQ